MEPVPRQAQHDEVEARRVNVRGGYDRRVGLDDDASIMWIPDGFDQDTYGSAGEG